MRSVFVALAVLCLAPSVSEAKKKEWQPSAPAAPSFGDVEKVIPICRDRNRAEMRTNNDEVIKWKETTKNQYLDRALIIGKLVRVIQQRPSHTHLEIDLEDSQSIGDADHIEIIYNREFGDVKNVKAGDLVAACGDYITSNADTGRYKPSPNGAIVHWVHASNNPSKHSHGFLNIAGTLYGYEGDGAKQKPEMGRGSEDASGDDLPWEKLRRFSMLPVLE